MEDSIFTKIIKGEIPCHKVYEDAAVLAFLDIHPAVPGHTLVVSKRQLEQLWDLPDDEYQSLLAASKKVALRLREVLRPARVGVQVMGLDVPHVHIHLLPFNTADDFFHRPNPDQEPDHATLAAMAQKLAF